MAADYYIDLHSGDDYEQLTPYIYYAGCADEDVVQMSRKMAEQADVPYMVKSNVASGGSYNYAAACGIPSVLIERGQMGGWSPEEVHSTGKDVRNILCALGVYDGMRSYSNYYPMEIEDVRYQSASVSGCGILPKNREISLRLESILAVLRIMREIFWRQVYPI